MVDSFSTGKEEVKMNPSQMFREETFTDRRTGSVKMLTPVDKDGNDDHKREIVFMGEAQLMTPMGAMPLSFKIEAKSLGEAAENFSAAAKLAVEKAAKELQELRREAASSIVIPEGAGHGGAAGGGILGGGNIKMP